MPSSDCASHPAGLAERHNISYNIPSQLLAMKTRENYLCSIGTFAMNQAEIPSVFASIVAVCFVYTKIFPYYCTEKLPINYKQNT